MHEVVDAVRRTRADLKGIKKMPAPRKIIPKYARRGSQFPVTIQGDALSDVASCDFGPGIDAGKPFNVKEEEFEVEIAISDHAPSTLRQVKVYDSRGVGSDPAIFPLEFEVK